MATAIKYTEKLLIADRGGINSFLHLNDTNESGCSANGLRKLVLCRKATRRFKPSSLSLPYSHGHNCLHIWLSA